MALIFNRGSIYYVDVGKWGLVTGVLLDRSQLSGWESQGNLARSFIGSSLVIY